jgi:hypothetical protein
LDKVSTTIEASKPTIRKMQKTVEAAGKSAAQGAKAFAGEVADAAAAARTATTAAAGAVLDKVARAIETRAVKGAKAFTGKAATRTAPGVVLDKVATAKEAKKSSSRAKKSVATKKRAAPKKRKANTKNVPRKAAKKKRI